MVLFVPVLIMKLVSDKAGADPGANMMVLTIDGGADGADIMLQSVPLVLLVPLLGALVATGAWSGLEAALIYD